MDILSKFDNNFEKLACGLRINDNRMLLINPVSLILVLNNDSLNRDLRKRRRFKKIHKDKLIRMKFREKLSNHLEIAIEILFLVAGKSNIKEKILYLKRES